MAAAQKAPVAEKGLSQGDSPTSTLPPPSLGAVRRKESLTLGKLFQNCIKPPVAIQLDVRTALNDAQYQVTRFSETCNEFCTAQGKSYWLVQDAARNPRVCNLQLRVELAAATEIESYPARMAAAGYLLSVLFRLLPFCCSTYKRQPG